MDATDPREPSMALWRLGMSHTASGFAGGLWQIWGRITDEWTHPNGDASEAVALARESAAELIDAIGDEARERAYCDRWVHDRLDIVLPAD